MRRLAQLLLLTASLAVSLGALELALRWTGRFPIPPERVVCSNPQLYEAYPPHGYRLHPSLDTTYSYPSESRRLLSLRSNDHGFRGARDLSQRDPRPRIIVLGDSLTFGLGVAEEEPFTDRLQAARPEWRVDNLGMTGFGPDLMLRALEQVGAPLRPDVVVLTIFSDDFRRVRPEFAGVGFEIPRFVLRSGRLASIEYPRRTFWTRWSIVSAERAVMWYLSNAEWELNAAILDRFREHASSGSFELVIVFLPARLDTPLDYKHRQWLRRYAERTHTRFTDLTDAILSKGSESMFLANNPHLNPQGHQAVADALLPYLSDVVRRSEKRVDEGGRGGTADEHQKTED